MYQGTILSFDPTTQHGLIQHDALAKVWPFLGADCAGMPIPGRHVSFDLGLRQFGTITAQAAIDIR